MRRGSFNVCNLIIQKKFHLRTVGCHSFEGERGNTLATNMKLDLDSPPYLTQNCLYQYNRCIMFFVQFLQTSATHLNIAEIYRPSSWKSMSKSLGR